MCGRYTVAHSNSEILERFEAVLAETMARQEAAEEAEKSEKAETAETAQDPQTAQNGQNGQNVRNSEGMQNVQSEMNSAALPESQTTKKPRSLNFNVAPTQTVPIIVNTKSNEDEAPTVRVMEFAKWGFLPFWSKDPKKIKPMINAKSETIAESKLFKHSFAKKRCIIPADSFYEWKRTGDTKVPMRIMLKDHSIFGFAGIYDESKDADGNVVRSCSIITTSANDLVSDVHDRMPVILPRTAESLWLDNKQFDAEQLQQVMKSYPSELMEMYPVSDLVNSVKNNSPACLEPRSESEVPSQDQEGKAPAKKKRAPKATNSKSDAAVGADDALPNDKKRPAAKESTDADASNETCSDQMKILFN